MYAKVFFDEPSSLDYELFGKMLKRLHVKDHEWKLSGVKYSFQGTFTACEILFYEKGHPCEDDYQAMGITKKSVRDPWDSSVGMNVAFCRACRSAFDNKEK